MSDGSGTFLPATGAFVRRALALVAGSVLAVLIVHFPMIQSDFARTQADLVDSRFNNYLFEHSYLWLNHAPGHTSFWSPDFCYPADNLLAYSDVMVSFAPPYWVARVLGFEPDTAFQLWMLFATVTNFLLAYALFRRAIGFTFTASWCGATLFAIAASRSAQLGHQQLYFQAYVLITVYGLIRLVGADLRVRARCRADRQAADTEVRPHKLRYLFLAAAALNLQFWGGFYMALFLVLATSITVTWALILPCTRTPLLRRAVEYGRHPTTWLILILSAVSLYPLASHYFWISRTAAIPDDTAVTAMLPAPKSWLYMGRTSILYGPIDRFFSDLPVPPEHAIGLGLLTTIIAALGLWRNRRKPPFALLTISAFTLIILTTRTGDHFSLWWTVRKILPGAIALRAVARIGLLMILPAAVGVAAFIQHHQHRPRARFILIAIIALCFAEQLRFNPSYNKVAMRREVQSIAARVPADAKAFFYTGHDPNHWAIDQVDAMWASIQRGVPTINGYSGTWPPGLRRLILSDTLKNRPALERELARWRQSNDLAPDQVAWIIGPQEQHEQVTLSN